MADRHLARIGAAVFVGLAVAMTLVQLSADDPVRTQMRPSAWVPDGDPLPAQLRACARMGERALASSDCRAAWAEKRRRFFGIDHPGAYSHLGGDTSLPVGGASRPQGEAD